MEVVPNVQKQTLRMTTLRNVEPGSTISTDEPLSHGSLTDDGYQRGQGKHGAKE